MNIGTMKYKSFFTTVILCFLFAPFIKGQADSTKARNISIGFAVSNNDQVDNSIINFYRQESEYLNSFFNSPSSNQNTLKYNLLFSFSSKKIMMYGIKMGYQSITKKYNFDNYSNETEAKSSQSIYNFNPFVGHIFEYKKIEFVLGLQVPFFVIGEYNYNSSEKNFRGNSSGQRELQYISETKTTINSGYEVGLNGFLNIKYNLNKRFFIFSDISTGVLYASVGKTFSTETNTTYYGTYFPGYPPYQTTSSSDYNLKKTYFSSPEYSLGFGIIL